MTNKVPRLLAVSDAAARSGRPVGAWLEELGEAGVDGVQIREKELGDRELFELTLAVRRSWPGWLVVNGRLDVALAAGADGVHLPSEGVPVAALRKRFGDRVVIGRSTHRTEEVAAACEAGADYVTFGPVFPTPSKARYGRPPGLAGLREAAAVGLPVVALGGIGPEELEEAVGAGAFGVAGIRAFHEPRSLALWAGKRRTLWPEDR